MFSCSSPSSRRCSSSNPARVHHCGWQRTLNTRTVLLPALVRPELASPAPLPNSFQQSQPHPTPPTTSISLHTTLASLVPCQTFCPSSLPVNTLLPSPYPADPRFPLRRILPTSGNGANNQKSSWHNHFGQREALCVGESKEKDVWAHSTGGGGRGDKGINES